MADLRFSSSVAIAASAMALASSLFLAPAASAAPASRVRLSVCARLADEAKDSPALRAAIQRVEQALPSGGELTVEKLARAVVDSGVAAERPDMAVSYSLTSPSGKTGSVTAYALPGLISPPSLCIRVPWGPGRVEWAFLYPADYGYSVKPESSTNLIWANAPGQDIDGLYRRVWGSCTALKVPDSATATLRSANGSIEVCQNAAAALAGHVTKWINTCSGPDGAFPDYPL